MIKEWRRRLLPSLDQRRCGRWHCLLNRHPENHVHRETTPMRSWKDPQPFPAHWSGTTWLWWSGGKSGLLRCSSASPPSPPSCSATLCATPQFTSSSLRSDCRTTSSPGVPAPVDSAWQSWRMTPGSRSVSTNPSTRWWAGRTAPSLMKRLNGGR